MLLDNKAFEELRSQKLTVGPEIIANGKYLYGENNFVFKKNDYIRFYIVVNCNWLWLDLFI